MARNPTPIAEDVAKLRRVLRRQDGPTIVASAFAADVDPIKAKVMFAVQQPLHTNALGEVMGVPAWRALPSWFLIADGDQAIPPDDDALALIKAAVAGAAAPA